MFRLITKIKGRNRGYNFQTSRWEQYKKTTQSKSKNGEKMKQRKSRTNIKQVT